MSIQAIREKLAADMPAVHKHDAVFAATLANAADLAHDKSKHPADLRRAQSEIRNWTLQALDKPGALTGDSARAIAAAQAASDLLQHEIDLRVFGAAMEGRATPNASGWRDARTGAPIRVLAKGDRLAANAAPGTPSVGEILAHRLTGKGGADIQAALSSTPDSAGGFSIPTTVMPQFIDRLRASSRIVEAGARTLVLDDGRTRMMRIATDPTATWRAENSAVNVSDPTFGAVTFEPKSLACLVRVSVELSQDAVNVGEAIEAALIGSLSNELDKAAMFGGGTLEPTGIFTQAGNTFSMGTNGATPGNYDLFLDALFELEADNVTGPFAAIMAPRTARTLRKLKDAEQRYNPPPLELLSLPMLVSSNVPVNQTQGTSSAASTVLIGNFASVIIGVRQQLEIRILDQRFADNLEVAFLASMRVDVQLEQPDAICRVVGVLA